MAKLLGSYYDSHGTFAGYRDEDGWVHAEGGRNYIGRIDDDGSFYDGSGMYRGQVDSHDGSGYIWEDCKGYTGFQDGNRFSNEGNIGIPDADDRECDPFSIPPGFIATAIAIHLGKRTTSSRTGRSFRPTPSGRSSETRRNVMAHCFLTRRNVMTVFHTSKKCVETCFRMCLKTCQIPACAMLKNVPHHR